MYLKALVLLAALLLAAPSVKAGDDLNFVLPEGLISIEQVDCNITSFHVDVEHDIIMLEYKLMADTLMIHSGNIIVNDPVEFGILIANIVDIPALQVIVQQKILEQLGGGE